MQSASLPMGLNLHTRANIDRGAICLHISYAARIASDMNDHE